MNRLILAVAIGFMAISCKVDSKNKVETSDAKEVSSSSSAENLKVDVAASTLNWKGYKPTGEHFGTVDITNGELNIAQGKLVGGSFTINMKSIVDKDMAADNEYNAKLVGHLSSADFFDVEKFPTASFEISNVSENAGKLNVSGNLTVKGISKNITIPATLSNNGGTVVLKSETFKVDRTEFGITFKSTKLVDVIKEKSIDDLFEISFEVKATK